MASTARLLIIADDLTGALDAAAPFAQRGLDTRVLAYPTGAPESGVQSARVLAVNTESRHLPGADAARAVEEALQRYARPGDLLFKKIDSTLRGNVAAETFAALRATGRRGALIAPAFPAQGRTLRAGIVYVHGVALAETEFVRDALSPAPRAPLAHVLEAAAPGYRVAGVSAQAFCSDASAQVADQHLLLIDAQTQAELDAIVRHAQARALLGSNLLVGSAGLGHALAAALADAGRAPVRAAREGLRIFVIGSRAEKTRAQADALRTAPKVITIEAPNGKVSAAELAHALAAARANGALLLLATQASAAPQESAVVARCLAQTALAITQRANVAAIIASGGDTAKAILEQAQSPVVRVTDELMAGVALARFSYYSKEYVFVTKAGGFGQVDTLISIAALLA